jgi:hypothetical protein
MMAAVALKMRMNPSHVLVQLSKKRAELCHEVGLSIWLCNTAFSSCSSIVSGPSGRGLLQAKVFVVFMGLAPRLCSRVSSAILFGRSGHKAAQENLRLNCTEQETLFI